MSDASSFGFGKFIPGFDFLQGLAKSAGSATARPLGRLPEWVAPTVSIEEVDKRITELKAVQFWLDQNGKALAATIQALEVQRMTLSTLQGMNVSMGELAQAFQFPAAASAAATAAARGAASPGQGEHSDWPMSSAAGKANKKEKPQPAPVQAAAAPPSEPGAAKAADRPAAAETAAPRDESAQAAAMGQAMQWWGALTQQFQQIAAKAMAEPMAPEAVAAAQRATGMAGDLAKATMDRMAAQATAFAAQAGKAAATASKAPAAKTAAKAPAPSEAPKAAAKAPARPAARKAAAKTAAKTPAASKAAAKSRPPR
jgi:hypothetical protein